ncbi:MAG TPA: MerR family transcriptional regulator [Gemmatimonadaceae bacterium]
MRVVTRRTGMSAELLRVWERRYRVVTPGRTQTGRRLYSDAEIERLDLLHRATLGGRSIGLIAGLPSAALEELLRQDAEREPRRTAAATPPSRSPAVPAHRLVADSLAALERYDAVALGIILRRALVRLGALEGLERVVTAMLEQVGTRWRDGSLHSIQGHLAASVVRNLLETSIVASTPDARTPRLLLAALTGERHELGALMAGVVAASEGWSVTWLGANLNATDVAQVATRLRVRAVGLSLIHPSGDPVVHEELRRLRRALPDPIALMVGGSAAPSYAGTLDGIGSAPIADLTGLVERLRELNPGASSRRRRGKVTRRKKPEMT